MGKSYGEGNYEATRRYNEATKRFVQSGKVEEAARDAAPGDDAEALQLAAAEAEGRARAKEEDPMLTRKAPPRPPAGDASGTARNSPASDRDTPEAASEETRVLLPGADRSDR